jgi:hypothetical protein
MAMCTKLELAAVDDVLGIVDLRAAGAAKLTLDHGKGPWSGISTEKGVLFEMRNSRVFVVRRKNAVVASLCLTAKKPWAIDLKYLVDAE